MVFPEGWSYYKEYEQPGTADGEQTDYQVNITVSHVADKMRSDYGDIRFTLEDLTELSYHLVSYTESDEALFVVKIPTIPTTGVTIRCYYGNSGATTTSDPENTYDVYDGFDDGSLDTDKWTWIRESTGNWDEGTTQSGKLNIKTLKLELHGSANNAPVLRLHNPIAGNFIAECTLELSPTVNYQRGCLLIYSDDNNYIEMGYIYNSGQSGTNIFAKKEITATPLDYYTHVSISSLKVRIIKLGTTYYLYYDAGSGWTLFQTFTGIPFSTIYVALASESYSRGGGGLNVFYDDVKVYKTTANPPGIGSWGEEKEIGVDLTGQQLQGAGYINPVTLQNILELNPLEMEASINPLTVQRIIEMAELEASAEINPMTLQSLLKTSCTIKQPQSVKVKHKIT